MFSSLPLTTNFKSSPNQKDLQSTCCKLSVTEKLKFVLGKVENIMGKGENAGHQHFVLFPQCFQNFLYNRVIKNRDCVVNS